MQEMKKRFSGMIAGFDQDIDFEDEAIVLEVEGGVQDGWTITLPVYPRVRLMLLLRYCKLGIIIVHFFVLFLFCFLFQMLKEKVDRFEPSSPDQQGPMKSGRIPSCHLQAKWIFRDEPPVDLSRKVKLIGAKEPNDFFLLTIDCGALQTQGKI